MNWIVPTLTFVLGLSVSAVLFLGWLVFRPLRREKALPAQPDMEEGPSVRQLPVPAASVNRSTAVRMPAQTIQTATPVGFENPRRAFHSAFVSGDTEAAIALLPELEHMLGGRRKRGFLLAAGALASAGRREAVPCLLDALQSGEELDDDELLQSVVASTVQYYLSTDREPDGLNELEDVIKGHAYDKTKSERTRAFIANQLQMLYFGSNRVADARSIINYVIELSPSDPSYYYNKSLILEQLGELDDAVRAIEKCMELDIHDDKQHLLQALDLYGQIEDEEKMRATEVKLQA